MQRVVVGLSGGVDSAVCAMLLRKQGFEVHGLFLDQGLSARADAERTAAAMGVPLHIADIRSELERAVCARLPPLISAERRRTPAFYATRPSSSKRCWTARTRSARTMSQRGIMPSRRSETA